MARPNWILKTQTVTEKTKNKMTFTKEQLKVHGETVLAWLNGAEIEYYSYTRKQWIKCKHHIFHPDLKHRVKPKPIFVNELGEEFTQQDLDNNIDVFFYSLDDMRGWCYDIQKVYGALDETRTTTAVSKSHQGALQLAINKLNRK